MADESSEPAPIRAVYLLMSDLAAVDTWAEDLRRLFRGEDLVGTYIVGSALRTSAYRDVDIRLVVDDNVAGALASMLDIKRLNLALSTWGQRMTGLPIECQVQSLTEAGTYDGPVRPCGRQAETRFASATKEGLDPASTIALELDRRLLAMGYTLTQRKDIGTVLGWVQDQVAGREPTPAAKRLTDSLDSDDHHGKDA